MKATFHVFAGTVFSELGKMRISKRIYTPVNLSGSVYPVDPVII